MVCIVLRYEIRIIVFLLYVVVEILFTEDHYLAAEPDLVMPVVVTKFGIIASDITLAVTPLTVAEAEAQGIQLSGVVVIPPENPDGQGLENTRARSK